MKGINNISNKKGFLITALSASSCVGMYAGSSCSDKINFQKVTDGKYIDNYVTVEEGGNISTANDGIKAWLNAPNSDENFVTIKGTFNKIKGKVDKSITIYKEGSDFYLSEGKAAATDVKKGITFLTITFEKDKAVDKFESGTGSKEQSEKKS